MIQTVNLNKSYRLKRNINFQVLFNINLKIENGEMIAIRGPSGSGKSTLLHILSGLIPFDSGRVSIGNMDLHSASMNELAKMRNTQMAIILQNFGLIDDLSVYDNVQLPLCFSSKNNNKQNKAKVEQILHEVEMEDYKNKPVYQLSGGQKQRVAIARGLVIHPSYILADEPTGSLNSEAADNVMALFKRLNQNGTTIIIVTHNFDIAKQCSRDILIKDGRITNT